MTVVSLADKLSADEEAALVDALKRIIRDVGIERVLTRPIVLPDEKHFPDRWSPTPLGVARLVRRMLRFAGMPALQVIATSAALVEHHSSDASWQPMSWATSGNPVYLAGIKTTEDVPALVVVVDPLNLDDADMIVGVIALEVARAFRLLEGVVDTDQHREAKLVDLTALALGFGVLVSNNAHRLRSRGEIRGNLIYSEHKRTEIGATSPRALSFAFGLLAAARGLDVGALKSALETNQGTWLVETTRRFARDEVARMLGLPESADARPSIRLDEMLAPIDDSGIFADDLPPPEEEGIYSGQPIFRVGDSHWGTGLAAGLFAGGALGIIMAINIAPPLAVVTMVTGCAIGIALGRRRKFDQCASCGVRIPDDGDACPGCGGFVAGRIKRAADRLDAEDAWRKQRRADLDAET